MTHRILQFGTSRFLQAHADLFVHEARGAGQDIGPITIVKTTQGGARSGRVAAFGDPAGFPVRIRGRQDGAVVDQTVRVASVARALDAHAQWADVARIFAEEIEIVFSNVGDGGYRLDPGDQERRPAMDETPRSFPAKLLALLIRRFEGAAAPLLVFPCELVNRNGQVLRGLLDDLGDRWELASDFRHWLASEVLICNTLVDRIVSEPIEPVGAVAEPYALWAIQRARGMIEPFQHPCVSYVADLEPYVRLKLHILNLGHTYIAEVCRNEGRLETATVSAFLNEPRDRALLLSLYEDEVLPGFAARGMGEQARRYVAATLERFENPFINHRVSDIFDNHNSKLERRVRDFIAWVRGADSSLALPRLEALVAGLPP